VVETITWLGRNHAIVQLVAVLRNHQYRIGRMLLGGLLHHGVMDVRIERRMQGFDARAVMASQDFAKLLGAFGGHGGRSGDTNRY